MTEKELLYFEDAIMHEDSIIKICSDISNNLQDENLRLFIQNEISKHEDTKNNLINLLEVSCNE